MDSTDNDEHALLEAIIDSLRKIHAFLDLKQMSNVFKELANTNGLYNVASSITKMPVPGDNKRRVLPYIYEL